MNRTIDHLIPFALLLVSWLHVALAGTVAAEAPLSPDDRLTVELFAEHPQIVTPTGIAVDDQGRVFVAESHTHFRPDDYDGPPADRILIFADTDGDGRADRRTIFHQGFTHVMDIEFHASGALYVATRMDIHRMRDLDGDGRADEVTPVVRMETAGTYPHDGLSGLAFDFNGHLHFGLGENLGHEYTLIGSDGTRISGGAEGGSTYHVRADGTGLRRVSTGWWNPFGMCVDAFGRVFGTDNDPGASPPCRLIQVIEAGDYGYEYRYGRTGLHPLVTWTAEIPGTLPMIAGTGEAPCAIVAYESDALPAEYRGHLLLASWADHRIEHYPLTQQPDQGLVTTARQTLVAGGNEFRPVGLAIAPDGTVYVSDWVSSSYTLHKLGRIWRIRPRQFPRQDRSQVPQRALLAKDQALRERAARQLAKIDTGRRLLRDQVLHNQDARVRAAALQALIMVDNQHTDFAAVARQDDALALRVLALRHLLKRGSDPGASAALVPLVPSVPLVPQRLLKRSADPGPWVDVSVPLPVRVEAIGRLDTRRHGIALLNALRSRYPLEFHAAVAALSRQANAAESGFTEIAAQHPLGGLLARKRHPAARQQFAQTQLGRFLTHADLAVRYAAVKWIADDKLTQYQPQLAALLQDEQLTLKLFLAVSATLDWLNDKEPTDRPSPKLLLKQIVDERVPVALRRLSLRLIDPAYRPLTVQHLAGLLKHDDQQLRLEATRTLAAHPSEARFAVLAEVARDGRQSAELRAVAIAGLAPVSADHVGFLTKLANRSQRVLRDQALRALIGVELPAAAKQSLSTLAASNPNTTEAVARILTGTPGERPPATEVDAWMKLIHNPGDPAAGERIFFGMKVGTCSRCHQVNGRGTAVGPDLTKINQRLAAAGSDGRRWLLETILQPSQDMAPQYTPWMIITLDGDLLVGLPRRKGGRQEAYLGQDGKEFFLAKEQIEQHGESATSLMPEDLLKYLTSQELSDLLAFVTQQR